MITAAQAYCLSNFFLMDASDHAGMQERYERDLVDEGDLSYWEAAANVYNVLVERSEDGFLTSAQAFYVSKVYPERVRPDECQEDFEAADLSPSQIDFWGHASLAISSLARGPNFAPAL